MKQTRLDAREAVVRIEKVVAGGAGIGRIEGRVVFVQGALPGELALIRLVEVRKDYARAELVALLESSAHRVEPECPHYGECGGCDLMHASSDAQAALKKAILSEVFSRTAGLSMDFGELVASPLWGYRNRVQLHAAPDGRLGYRRRAGHAIIAVDRCPVVCAPLEDFIRSERAVAGSRMMLLSQGGRVYGADCLIDVGGRSVAARADCFFQSNISLVPALVREVLDAAGHGEHALDLYGGVGLFSVFLAERFAEVSLVESDERACGRAAANVGKHRIICRDAQEALRELKVRRSIYDAIVADPPRAGLSPAVLSLLVELGPRRLVYVSCNPVTLARDAARLNTRGYRMASARVFDFYPQTSHMEAVCLFLPFGRS